MTMQDRRGTQLGLGARLGLMVLVALLPLGVLSVIQTQKTRDMAEDSQLLAVAGETLRVAADEVRIIRGAETAAATLAASIPEIVGDTAACHRVVDALAETQGQSSSVAYVPLSGITRCASGQGEANVSDSPLFHALTATPEPRVVVNAVSQIARATVLAVGHPVFDAAGRQIGIVSITLRHQVLTESHGEDLARHGNRLVTLITFDRTGTILTSISSPVVAEQELPRERPLSALAQNSSPSFAALSVAGQKRLYAVVEVSDDLYLLGVWRPAAEAQSPLSAVSSFVYPLLMWIAGLAMAIIGAERLVTRHVRRLSGAMRDFAFGERKMAEVALDNPPPEIAGLAEAYSTLTETILRDEADLENLVHQKEDLLREVHHRTGNSLQLIASFLRMHRRETTDEEVRLILDNLHDRVMNLSTVHLGLYRMAGREDVAVDELMAEVIGKVSSIHWRSGRRDRIISELHPLILGAQQAVPLALLLAEILSCFPAAEINEDSPPVLIRLERQDDTTAQLVIAGPSIARGTLMGERDGAPSIIAARLIRGFVTQIDGTLAVSDAGSDQVVATIDFPIRHNTPA